jgi:crossover junction endodeoxyribonuclease RuvC
VTSRTIGWLPGRPRHPRLGERMFDSLVLGVDPGIATLGLAVLGRAGRSPALVWSETVVTDPRDEESARLLTLVRAVRAAIDAHAPAAVAVERVAFNRNAVSALGVARATGAVMAAAAEAGIAVREYSPTEVKSAVTGMGNADKAQVARALERVHGLHDVPVQPDAADAVAVALTHLTVARLARSVARSKVAR